MTNVLQLPIVKEKTSAKYALVPTRSLIEKLESVGMQDVLDLDTATAGRGGGGTRHHINIPIKSDLLLDGVRPSLTIINSYEGECSLKVLVGFYRMACSNGMVVGQGTYQQKVRHIKGHKLSAFLDTFQSRISAAVYDIPAIMSYVDGLRHIYISQSAALDTIRLLVSAKVITKKAGSSALNIYSSGKFRRLEDFAVGNTIYGLWNILNEELRRTATKRTSEGTLLAKNTKLLDNILEVSGAA